MRLFVGLFCCFIFGASFAQNIKVSGNITDKNTGETLIGASVIYGKGMGNSKWRMENGEWGMRNGEWGMENGELRIEN